MTHNRRLEFGELHYSTHAKASYATTLLAKAQPVHVGNSTWMHALNHAALLGMHREHKQWK
jgi:hypothetical protein